MHLQLKPSNVLTIHNIVHFSWDFVYMPWRWSRFDSSRKVLLLLSYWRVSGCLCISENDDMVVMIRNKGHTGCSKKFKRRRVTTTTTTKMSHTSKFWCQYISSTNPFSKMTSIKDIDLLATLKRIRIEQYFASSVEFSNVHNCGKSSNATRSNHVYKNV